MLSALRKIILLTEISAAVLQLSPCHVISGVGLLLFLLGIGW